MSVLNFIKRFKDCDWLTGNCYYFAAILRDRFDGCIFYDTIAGHFVTYIEGDYYDYAGVYNVEREDALIKWSWFKEYDSLQYERIIRDCVENESI